MKEMEMTTNIHKNESENESDFIEPTRVLSSAHDSAEMDFEDPYETEGTDMQAMVTKMDGSGEIDDEIIVQSNSNEDGLVENKSDG